MTHEDLQKHFARLRKLGFLALAGLLLTLGAIPFFDNEPLFATILIVGALLWIPLVFYLVVFTLWHWKGRYRGEHSNLWGALLLIETSGWFKVLYFFRHALPDLRRTGRYSPS